jgi:hypothetical protein
VGTLPRTATAWGRKTTAKQTSDGLFTLDPSDDRQNEWLKDLILSDLRRAISSEQFDYRNVGRIIEREPAFGDKDYSFAAHRTFSLSANVTADGEALLHVESGHTIRSMDTIADRFTEDEDLPSVTVVHDTNQYGRQGRAILGNWSEYCYTDVLPNLGDSLENSHEGIINESLRKKHAEQDTRLVTLSYDGGRTYNHQLPHVLKLSPDLDSISWFDSEFASLFNSRKALLPDERATNSREFIEQLSRLPTLGLEFNWGPTNGSFNNVNARDNKSRLVFAGGKTAAKPKDGLADYGAHSPPDEYTITILCPERFSNIGEELPKEIVSKLVGISAPGATKMRQYTLGDESEYSSVWRDVPDNTSVVLAVVPDKEKVGNFPVDDPHNELKRTLMRKGIPSQMVQKQTAEALMAQSFQSLSNNLKLLNILSAVVAKAGGTPWQLADLPGQTDAFLGLDVSYDSETDEHTGASASVVLGDGTSFAAESVTKQSGERFDEQHITQFVRDLASDLTDHMGVNPSRLCVMRDGKIHENTDIIRDGLSGLATEVDIVGVRKTGQPRIAKFDGTSFELAPKGHVFVDDDRDHAILHTFGKPELRDGNRSGTPRTIRLIKDSGPTDIETLARQAYWLTEMHVGSPGRSTRIPVPIEYADKAAEYVSDGFASPGEIIHGPAFL